MNGTFACGFYMARFALKKIWDTVVGYVLAFFILMVGLGLYNTYIVEPKQREDNDRFRQISEELDRDLTRFLQENALNETYFIPRNLVNSSFIHSRNGLVFINRVENHLKNRNSSIFHIDNNCQKPIVLSVSYPDSLKGEQIKQWYLDKADMGYLGSYDGFVETFAKEASYRIDYADGEAYVWDGESFGDGMSKIEANRYFFIKACQLH